MIVSAMMSRCDRKETRTRTQGTPAQTRDHNISSGGLQHRYRIILTDNHFHYGAINRNMCATKDHFHRDDTPCASPRANLGSTDRGPPPPPLAVVVGPPLASAMLRMCLWAASRRAAAKRRSSARS